MIWTDLKINSLYPFYLGFPLTDTDATRKPLLTTAKLGYRLSFRIVNENLTNPDSQSPEYREAVESITNKVRRYVRIFLPGQVLKQLPKIYVGIKKK